MGKLKHAPPTYAAGNQHFEAIEMPGLNREYGPIDETIAPAVLEKFAIWIARL